MSRERGDNSIILKVMVYGSKPVSQALGQICKLLGLSVVDDARNGAAVSDILIMADGEEILRKPIISGNEKLIYLESNNKSAARHDLFYLTYLLPTYRIPLEQFSIIELSNVIADIKVGEK